MAHFHPFWFAGGSRGIYDIRSGIRVTMNRSLPRTFIEKTLILQYCCRSNTFYDFLSSCQWLFQTDRNIRGSQREDPKQCSNLSDPPW